MGLSPIAQAPVPLAWSLTRPGGSFLNQSYPLQLTDAALGLPLGEWGRCRAALVWHGVPLWAARLVLDEIERVDGGGGEGRQQQQEEERESDADDAAAVAAAAAAAEACHEEPWEVCYSGAGGFQPRIPGVTDPNPDTAAHEGQGQDEGNAEMAFELLLGCTLAAGPARSHPQGQNRDDEEEDEKEERWVRAAVPVRVWGADLVLCAEDELWGLPSRYAVLKALALCAAAVRQQRGREQEDGMVEVEGDGGGRAAARQQQQQRRERRLRARFRGAWVLVEVFAAVEGGKGQQSHPDPQLQRFHLSPLLPPAYVDGSGTGAIDAAPTPPLFFGPAAGAPLLVVVAATDGDGGASSLPLLTGAGQGAGAIEAAWGYRVWLLDVRTRRAVVLGEGRAGPLAAANGVLLLPLGHSLEWRVAVETKGGSSSSSSSSSSSQQKGVRLLPCVVGPDVGPLDRDRGRRALPVFEAFEDLLACLEVCLAGVPADGTGDGAGRELMEGGGGGGAVAAAEACMSDMVVG